MTRTRLVAADDAAELVEVVRANRDFLAPWEPLRDERWYSLEGQVEEVGNALDRHRLGLALPHVILDDSSRIVGRITLSGITRGAFQSCALGYWVAGDHTGRGLATGAVGEMLRLGFEDLRLHRVQAETLLENRASQRVLERHGFVRYGLAPQYLEIAGRWQDHVVFQRLNPDWT